MTMSELTAAGGRALARSAAVRALPQVLSRAGAWPGPRPAALRIERSHVRSGDSVADQTALTVWFGSGPTLPGPTVGARAGRIAVRGVVGLLGAAAIGVAGVLAARSEAGRLSAARPVGRLEV